MKKVIFSLLIFIALPNSNLLKSQTICTGDILPLLNCPGSVTATCLGEDVTLPPLSQSSNLPTTEYIITQVGVPADDGLGDVILGSSVSSIFDPSSFGLVPGDQFDVTPVSYDLNNIQNIIDAVYNGFGCCFLFNLVVPNFCANLMGAGINSGSDIQNINDVLVLVDLFAAVPGSTVSIAGFLASVEQINTDSGALGGVCGGPLFPICGAAGTGSGICRYELFPAGSCTVAASLMSFQGKQKSKTISLEWTTTIEVNNKYFDVQRSSDGSHFNSLGRVIAIGTSQTQSSYIFSDVRPSEDQNMYRLAMVDQDGDIDYSNIIQVNYNLEEHNQFEIYPNPVLNEMTLEINSSVTQQAYFQIFNTTGKIFKEGLIHFEKGTNSFNFNISDTQKGLYFIRISGLDGNLWMSTFVKN